MTITETETESTTYGLFVYGLVDSSYRLPDGLRGVDGSPVEMVRHGRVGAVVGRIALERGPGRRADLMAYADVVDALAAHGTVAPVRFGSVMADRDQVVADLLAAREDELAAVLESLEGLVQYRLDATYVEDAVLAEVVAADPRIAALRESTRETPLEAAYAQNVRLGELVAQGVEERRQQDAAALIDELRPYVADLVTNEVSNAIAVLAASLLVAEDQRQPLEERLETLAEAWHERMRLRLVGPTAPYDFAGAT